MEQRNLFGNIIPSFNNNKVKSGLTKIENGEYLFFPDFFSKSESDLFLQKLKDEIEWKQESMNMYGKQIDFPRLTAWYGDNDKPYSFSGITLQPKNWTKELLEIKDKIEPLSNVQFNSVLLNRYRSGNDSISWHTDAEKELGKNPVIASVNFGATRKFQLRHIKTKEKVEIELTHGCLLIMQGELQHFWQHQVPKSSKVVNERINLTFRVIKL
jgi:alkylated DNA repair dioxygenase AlkB